MQRERHKGNDLRPKVPMEQPVADQAVVVKNTL
jgi:hypothetical protein